MRTFVVEGIIPDRVQYNSIVDIFCSMGDAVPDFLPPDQYFGSRQRVGRMPEPSR